MADSQAKKDWNKANTTTFSIRLNHNTDKDIIAYLADKKPQTEVKRLLRLAARSANQN